MALDEILTQEIVRRTLAVAEPDRVILFGSAATGQMTPDSDIELLVVEPSPDNTRNSTTVLRGMFSLLLWGKNLRARDQPFLRYCCADVLRGS